jgi:hypothetical protein
MTRALIVTLLLLCPLAASAQQRKFFLTKDAAAATQALKACGPGFHMAATFELVDAGVLRYDTTKGMTMADSGSGPPVGVQGWIHSGTSAPPWCCNGWTDRSETNTGGVLLFAIEPVRGPSTQFSLVSCQGERSVWCIED